MIIPYIDDESVYAAAFEQTGYGMPRYRGSPMMGGRFWGRIVSFAKGLFSKAAPHISNLVTQAQPHMKRIAGKAVESAIDNAVTSVTEKLTKQQSGAGKKRKRPKLKGSKIK